MEELLLLIKYEKPSIDSDHRDVVAKIIERIFENDYEDNSVQKIKYILMHGNKSNAINLIKEYMYILINDGILSKEPASEYLSSPIFKFCSDSYYVLRHVIDYMDFEDKKRGFSASSNEAQFIRTGRITSFDQQAGSELQELMALGDLELLKYLLHKTYDLNVKTADANQLNYQSIMIDSIISMLLDRKVITEDGFSQPNFDVSIRAKQKKYFIDKRYLAQL